MAAGDFRTASGDPHRHLPLVALSDTHLGVPYSLLHSAEGRDFFFETLHGILDNRGHIGTLVLLGDILELSQVTDEQAFLAVQDFLHDLLTRFTVQSIIFIPGNHDHHIWYRSVTSAFLDNAVWIGALNVKGNLFTSPFGEQNFGEFVGRILRPEDEVRVPSISLVYPDMLFSYGDGDDAKHWVFHHGHLVKRSFVAKDISYRLQRVGLVQLAKARAVPGFNVDEPWRAHNLFDLQRRTQAFFETIFYPKDEEGQPPNDAIVHFLYLHQREKKIWQSDENEFSLAHVEKKYVSLIRHYMLCGGYEGLAREGAFRFVFGDSHDGGYRKGIPLAKKGSYAEVEIDLFNTGFWLVTGRNVQPRPYVYVIDEGGDSFLHRIEYPAELFNAARERGLSWRKLSLRGSPHDLEDIEPETTGETLDE